MDPFLATVPARYRRANRAAINGMLSRPSLAHGFLNTKQNSITLADYTSEDGLAGPDFLYGWIQSRGLDALVHHARAMGTAAPSHWHTAIERLARSLPRLRDSKGHGYFCYDARTLRPLLLRDGRVQPQAPRDGRIFTPSDIYLATALAVAALHAGDDCSNSIDVLMAAHRALDEGTFLADETLPPQAASLKRQGDPGLSAWMTLMGSALSLARLGHAGLASFATDIVEKVFSRYLDPGTMLLREKIGADACAGGLAMEFSGFALGYCLLGGTAGPERELARIAEAAFRHCFTGAAIPTYTALDGGSHSGLFPWWPLAEAIRALAMSYEVTGEAAVRTLWEDADAAFFSYYWRSEAAIAYQMRDSDGPIPRSPATPDLDPGYHTGLSLLDSARVAERLGLPIP